VKLAINITLHYIIIIIITIIMIINVIKQNTFNKFKVHLKLNIIGNDTLKRYQLQ